jgi:acyl carrier protein
MVISPKSVNKHKKTALRQKEYSMFEKVKELLVEELSVNPDDITLNAELVNDLGINSLELADLVLLCEEKFDLEISDDDIHKFVTIGDIVEYLNNKSDL